jgi:hypothetical protein
MEAAMTDGARKARTNAVRAAACAALALGTLGVCGCSGIDHATLDGVTTMPDDSNLSPSGGVMHTGIATGFKPRVWTHDLWGSHEESSGIDVTTSNASVLRVAHVSNDPRVVVWASAPGSATLSITLNGETALAVQVNVTDPAQ